MTSDQSPFITGGSGFIGTAVVRRLRAEGRTCVILDKVEPGDRYVDVGALLIPLGWAWLRERRGARPGVPDVAGPLLRSRLDATVGEVASTQSERRTPGWGDFFAPITDAETSSYTSLSTGRNTASGIRFAAVRSGTPEPTPSSRAS